MNKYTLFDSNQDASDVAVLLYVFFSPGCRCYYLHTVIRSRQVFFANAAFVFNVISDSLRNPASHFIST